MPRPSKDKQRQQQEWEDKISRAKKVRKTWKDLFRVQLALDYLDGKQRPPEYNASEWITINNVYSHLKALLPALYSADPYFYVKIRRSYVPSRELVQAYEQVGKRRGAMLNYLKDELELKTKARLGIQDAMFSYGILKSYHHSTMVDNPDAGKPILADNEEDPLIDDDGKPIFEPDQIPINSRYGLSRVHPDDFLWDEDSGPLEENWTWVAQRIRIPFEDLESNPMFSKSALKKAKAKGATTDEEEKDREDRKKGSELSGGGSGHSYFATDDDRKQSEIAIVWEIYNLKKDTWLVICEGGEEPLIPEEATPKGIEKHPFAILRFSLRDDSPYPIPPMSQGIDVSREYNIARSDLLKHRKRFNRKYEIYMPALVGEEEADKLESGEDGTMIKKQQPMQAVIPIADAPLDQMRWQELSVLKNDMIELFGGSSDEARGIAGADSATQAGILDKRLEMKEGDALSMVVDWIRVVARKLDQLVQAHLEADEYVRVTGPDGDYMTAIRSSDYQGIKGEFSYEVNVGATLPQLPQMERNSWMAFLQIIGQVPPLGTSRRLLKRMAELHHIEDETMIDELMAAMQKWMQMQAGGTGGGGAGSAPGVAEERPMSAVMGAAGGADSLSNQGL